MVRHGRLWHKCEVRRCPLCGRRIFNAERMVDDLRHRGNRMLSARIEIGIE